MSGLNTLSAKPSLAQPWLRRHDPVPAPRLRLVCFPYAGAGANAYRLWPRYFDRHTEIIGVQMPGREARLREPCAVDVSTVVKGVLDELMHLCPGQPLAIYGHSMGSVLAYELAWRLKERGWEPRALIVSGRLPPNVIFGGDLHSRPDDELIAAIKRLNGTPQGVFEDEEMRRLILPTLRSDYQLIETYRVPPNGVLGCPIGVCTSSDDADAPPDAMEQWRNLSSGRFSRWDFEGDHFFLRNQAAQMAAALNPYLKALGMPSEVGERAY
jgi:pyochelin biosynthetic protein PchC